MLPGLQDGEDEPARPAEPVHLDHLRGPRRGHCQDYSRYTDTLFLLGDPTVTAHLYRNFAYLYWEGGVICSIYMR